MRESVRDGVGVFRERVDEVLARVRRFERREWREFRRWVERTSTVVHLSVLVFVPLLIALVTALSNVLQSLSFLLFPPLAAGTYMLFADPEGEYASPLKFVAGLTVGALCGWSALVASDLVGLAEPTAVLQVGAVEAALAVFSVGVATWVLDIEEPAAYSTALLGLLVPPGQEFAFVVSVFVASSIVAAVFYVWRERVYERRAQFLYESTRGDDHVLVPMRGENPDTTAVFGARLAAAHDAGKVVLLDLVDDEYVARAEREYLADRRQPDRSATDGGSRPSGVAVDGPDSAVEDSPADETDAASDGAAVASSGDEATDRAVAESATHLEERASEIETSVGVPCEVVVAVAGRSPAATVRTTAREVNCDLVAASYEQRHGALSPYLQNLFRGRTDVVVHRSRAGRTRWKEVLVPVRRASDVAHGMLDFARRLVGRTGSVSVVTCVATERERRRAEDTLADLVEPFDGDFETRVSKKPIEEYLAEFGGRFDLVIIGASTDRSAASRFVSPPTFERIQDVEADVAIVDRG